MSAPLPEPLNLLERIDELLEELRVRWFMLDAQTKQVVLLLGLYAGYTLLDVFGSLAKRRSDP